MPLDSKLLNTINRFIKERLGTYGERVVIGSIYDEERFCPGCLSAKPKTGRDGKLYSTCDDQVCVDVSVGIPKTTEKMYRERLPKAGFEGQLNIEKKLQKVIKSWRDFCSISHSFRDNLSWYYNIYFLLNIKNLITFNTVTSKFNNMIKKKAIFLDRDGTLIEDKNYVYKIEDFELLPGVIDGLKLLQTNFIFIIITNQSGIGRGYYTENDFFNFNNHLINVLKEQGIKIEKTYFCPHRKENNCECRKPKTKFIDDAVSKYNIDVKESWMIGDHPSDILFGINTGCKTVFLLTGHGKSHLQDLEKNNIQPTLVSKDFLSAVRELRKLI